MMTTRKKQNLIKAHSAHTTDTGSASVQAALLTARIKEITEHLKIHKKDLSSRMGLVKMVSARRRMLNYIKKNQSAAYEPLIAKLQIRK
jgi:small subunit ribosomal protein S15